ncbi:MAG: glycosyltransferase family 2 protein [Porcipelethomonas sp.]
MPEIEVTVYCLAYNHEKYIRTALEGFVNQKTNFGYEVIVHDDASTDGTADIIREFEKNYPNIIKPIYQKENQHSKGIKIIKTFILPKAQGKYIASCEGDDYWTDPLKLQKQYDALESHPECSLSTHRVKCSNEDDSPNARTIPEDIYKLHSSKIINETELLELYFLRGGYPFHTSSYFFRKKVLYEKVELVRDVGILRKCLINGSVYYFEETMSVRRLWTIGNFNSRLKKKGGQGRIALYKSNVNNDINLDKYTNGKYHNYIAYSVFENIINIGIHDSKEAIKLLKMYEISFFESTKILAPFSKLKFGIKYITLKACPLIYTKYAKLRGLN